MKRKIKWVINNKRFNSKQAFAFTTYKLINLLSMLQNRPMLLSLKTHTRTWKMIETTKVREEVEKSAKN